MALRNVEYIVAISILMKIINNKFDAEPCPIKIAGIIKSIAPNCFNPPLIPINTIELNALLRPINSGRIFLVTHVNPKV